MEKLNVSELIEQKFGEQAVELSLEQWKKAGNKVFGLTCNWVPEELLFAANIVPRRFLAKLEDFEPAERYVYLDTCPYIRTCLLGTIQGLYNIDGIVYTKTCDQPCRMGDILNYYVPFSFSHSFLMPRKRTTEGEELFAYEIRQLKEKLEEYIGGKISDEALNKACETYNKSRILMRRLQNLRNLDAPPVSGNDALTVMKAAMTMPKNTFNGLLESLLAQLEAVDGTTAKSPRIVIAGALMDKSIFHKAIEEYGGIVVAEDTCMGYQYFGFDGDDVEIGSDPTTALIKRYLYHMPCSAMFEATQSGERYENLIKIVKESKADGVIFQHLQFCDCYSWDAPIYEEELNKLGIPCISLKTDYSWGSYGQIRTRVEAFLEMISIL